MTTIPPYQKPAAGKEAALRFLLSDADFIYQLADYVRSAELDAAAKPIPRDAIYFLRLLLHSAGNDREHADLITGLALLDNAIVERNIPPLDFRNLEQDLQVVKAAVLDEIKTRNNNAPAQFDAFIRNASQLANTENFRAYAATSLPLIRANTIATRLHELGHIETLLNERGRELEDNITPRDEDAYWQELSGLRERVGGQWVRQESIVAARSRQSIAELAADIFPISAGAYGRN